MCLLLLLSFVTFVFSDELLFDKNDPHLEKKQIWEGGVFKHAITIDKSTSPYTVALMIDGNGLRDEAKVNVDDPDKLRVSDHYHTVAAGLSDRAYGVMSKQDEPGVMYLVENGKCKKRTYNGNREREREEEITDESSCHKISEEIRKLDLEYEGETQLQQQSVNSRRLHMLYFRPPSRKLQKWELDFGGTFYFGAVLDTATAPVTFAMYISGNGIDDELYVRLDSDKDLNKVKLMNNKEFLFVDVITKEFKIICIKSKPGLMVKSKGGCKKTTYNEHSPTSKPTEEDINKNECDHLVNEFQMNMVKNPGPSEILYHNKDDEGLVKTTTKFGGTFYSGTVVDKSVTPHRVGIYMEGNGIEDEFHVFSETNLIKTLNQIDRLIFRVPTQDLSIIAKTNENGLVVIEKGECKRRIYDDEKPKNQPTLEMVSHEICSEKISEVEAALPLPPDIWFFKTDNQKVLKKTSLSGGTYQYGTVWDKRNLQSGKFKLGIYIKGEYLEDELHLDVKSDEEAYSVEVINESDKIIVKLPSQHFGAIAKVSSRSKLVVVEKGVCKRRMYKPRAIQLKTEIELEHDKCVAIMKEIGITPDSKEGRGSVENN